MLSPPFSPSVLEPGLKKKKIFNHNVVPVYPPLSMVMWLPKDCPLNREVFLTEFCVPVVLNHWESVLIDFLKS